MTLRRLTMLSLLTAFTALGAAGVAPAAGAPAWNLDVHHNQTVFEPGTNAQYWIDLDNVGDAETSGPITVTVNLPAGLTRKAVLLGIPGTGFVAGQGNVESSNIFNCPGAAGDTTIVCTSKAGQSIPRHHPYRPMFVEVKVAPGTPEGELTAAAEVKGGGAPVPATASEPTEIGSQPAGFGILPSSFTPDFLTADGATAEREAGAHPDLFRVPFDLNSVAAPSINYPLGKQPVDTLRDVHVDLPPGFLGNPTAVGECSQAQFTEGACPPSSQVGRLDLGVFFNSWVTSGVFNMAHPRGVLSDLAFVVAGQPVHVRATLDPSNRYAIVTSVENINESSTVFFQRLTLWGVPAAHSHDSERCKEFNGIGPAGGGDTSDECAAGIEPKPYLTLPSQCEADNTIRLHEYDSWQDTGAFGPDIERTLPGKMTDCDRLRFEPEVRIEPTGAQANTPTGLDVHVKVAQNENPDALATPPVRSTVVTLPRGMTVSPSFADGLEGCSSAQIGLETNAPVACPDSSRIGEVSLTTPLLPKPVEGSMYLAKQGDNPFGSLLAVYLALHDTEERGALIKLPGEVELDPATGQITTRFDDLPQFPFEDLTLKFRSGPRAPLVNPPSCGPQTIGVEMTTYAQPSRQIDLSNTYRVSQGPGGTPCPASLASRPFSPRLAAGTLNPLAGAFSPLELRVSRTDVDQELSTVEGIAPPGLIASLRGVGRCSDAQIAAAAALGKPGQGAEEIASPSCPASSQVGTLEAGAGAGPSPIYVPGKVYLAGPYKGAPLSGVAIVPAVAGPVDLGVVVVRAPAYVDPRTARIRIASDPLPQIVNGVLIRTRDVRVHLNRPGFALNPTSCDPMAIEAALHSTEGAVKSDSVRFQVGSCASLGFAPRLGLKLSGGTKRGAHPALRGVFRPRPGDANLQNLVLRLPRSAFLDQAHIRTICTRVQFAAKACPEGAIYGHATAYTSLLDQPLEGPVYLRSSNHNLPDFVAALHGTIDVEAVARIDSKNGGIRATFADVPDAPLEKVVVSMQGGKKGLIVNSTDLCRGKHRADARMIGQNGKRSTLRPPLRSSCRGKIRSKRG
ncbi:MAG TPA: hypothetical protein VFM94_01455 [Solirubrobacterales bacterium]|nr:hypothetical protein [Solirubrobacterales bacterium]